MQALLALAGSPALAQTAASLAKSAAVTSAAASKSVSKPVPGRWTCVSRTTVEIAPVSFDTRGSAEAWVMVHRVKGEVVAAERIDQQRGREVPPHAAAATRAAWRWSARIFSSSERSDRVTGDGAGLRGLGRVPIRLAEQRRRPG